jgi:hypothetical protein
MTVKIPCEEHCIRIFIADIRVKVFEISNKVLELRRVMLESWTSIEHSEKDFLPTILQFEDNGFIKG